jgi:two-component system OmpR family sensor kinase
MADAPPARRFGFLPNPRRWPVRWRLAAVSAALTFVILVAFAVVVGQLVSTRLHDDFNDELFDTANRLAVGDLSTLRGGPGHPDLGQMTLTGTAAVRIVYPDGRVVQTPNAPDFGSPRQGQVVSVGTLDAVSVPVGNTIPPTYLQYGRSTSNLNDTINRLWLFLACGVLGGTLLATFAGIAIAGRAMRPIAALTGTASQIASTRDPSRRVPQPETDDEVAELARTLEQMLRQLDAARSEREQMIQAQREFVADASHELRTPLTSILANLELLQEHLDGGGRDEDEIIGSALRSSRRMSRLVSDLLLLARADAGRTGVRRDCDLAEIVSAAASEVAPVAQGHDISVSAAGPVPVHGNPDELHRLTLNLLDNGIRHTPVGARIEVCAERSGEEAVVQVTDDGPGIPDGMETQVFSRFVRGSGPADVAADAGTGLGLAIVKAVATAHGGTVEAGNAPGAGARFTVRLPLSESASGNGASSERRETARAAPTKF